MIEKKFITHVKSAWKLRSSKTEAIFITRRKEKPQKLPVAFLLNIMKCQLEEM